MQTKPFWESKVIWSQVFAIILSVLAVVGLPNEYKLAVVAIINALNAIFTIAFRWDSAIPLGFKKSN